MKRSKYNQEFKEQAIKLVIEERLSVAKAASDIGVSHGALAKWVNDFKTTARESGAMPETEREELKRLRKENQTLKMERDLLKKVSIYFAKTTTNGAS